MKRDDLIGLICADLNDEGTSLYEFWEDDVEIIQARSLEDDEDAAIERELLEQSRRRVSRAQRRDEFWR